MRYLCVVLGYLTGKWKVLCVNCLHLDAEGKCFGHSMPPDIIQNAISCGFYKARANGAK